MPIAGQPIPAAAHDADIGRVLHVRADAYPDDRLLTATKTCNCDSVCSYFHMSFGSLRSMIVIPRIREIGRLKLYRAGFPLSMRKVRSSECGMSAPGTFRPIVRCARMSVVEVRADMMKSRCDFRFGPHLGHAHLISFRVTSRLQFPACAAIHCRSREFTAARSAPIFRAILNLVTTRV